MITDIREILPDEISDEAAYQISDFFYKLALVFESIYLGEIMRHKQSLIEANNQSDKPWGKSKA